MQTKEFFNLLEEHKEKELIFEYANGQFVPMAYHITEVKNVYFDSVDCGGNAHEERQTIVQLWSSPLEEKNRYMESGKALKIMEKVDSVKPINKETEIFFEYGNLSTPTSNYSVQNVALEDDKVILKMYVQATQCKPLHLKELVQAGEGCCGPSSKCC